ERPGLGILNEHRRNLQIDVVQLPLKRLGRTVGSHMRGPPRGERRIDAPRAAIRRAVVRVWLRGGVIGLGGGSQANCRRAGSVVSGSVGCTLISGNAFKGTAWLLAIFVLRTLASLRVGVLV